MTAPFSHSVVLLHFRCANMLRREDVISDCSRGKNLLEFLYIKSGERYQIFAKSVAMEKTMSFWSKIRP